MQKNFVDANALLLQIGVFYLTWGMLAYVLTLGKSSSTSRNWIFTGQIVMLVVEISLVLQEVKLPDWFLPTVTEHEIVWLMHNLFPSCMNGCRSIGSFYYVDVDELTRTTLLGIRASHTVSPEPLQFRFVANPLLYLPIIISQEILEHLKSIQGQMDTGGFAGKSATKRPLSEKVKEISPETSTVGFIPQNTGQSKSNSMGFYLMIMCYVLYYTWSQ